ncbi:uncharacterized protein LOC131841310 isoform X2 [Achroia grisella]|uniref:uncharacterized protein LOC131841310 isoform X2 n=1 Tax=Achroia grisella TaxID=688607 RepID=UPI0027D20CC4|nr:uncharacterized protein LOC131841310 isoform X2 [Achroia grisella]
MWSPARLAGALLLHVNLLLMVWCGAGLATAARLKWDPSTYVVIRELAPLEYRVSTSALCAASVALLLLTHLGTAGVYVRNTRAGPHILYAFAGLMSLLMVLEVGLVFWGVRRLLDWLDSPEAAVVYEALDLRDEIRTIMKFINRLYPLPSKIDDLLQEMEEDLPRNVYVAVVGVVLVAVSQPLAVVLACLTARGPGPGPDPDPGPAYYHSHHDNIDYRPMTDDPDISHPYINNMDPKRPLIRPVYEQRHGRVEPV